jgi:hypothetical protein
VSERVNEKDYLRSEGIGIRTLTWWVYCGEQGMEMWFVVMQVERSLSRSNDNDVDDVCRSDLKSTDVLRLLLCLAVDGVPEELW